MKLVKSLVFGFLVGLFGAGCSEEGHANDDPNDTSTTTDGGGGSDATATTTKTGQTASEEVAYPAGPYGISVGSIIQNYKFEGYFDPSLSPTALETVQMSDFYNPTADSSKALVLLIDVAARWCGPCQYEAGEVLPDLYAKYNPCGGEILLQLADGLTPGESADQGDLDSWTGKYNIDYPSTIDPTRKLSALFEADAFPANIMVDLTTMQIVEVLAGAPEEDSSFWTQYESYLDQECLAATE